MYDIELVDVSDTIENFKFDKVSEDDLRKIIDAFKNGDDYLDFISDEGFVLLERKGFRGIMYNQHVSRPKTVRQENQEESVEVSKVTINKGIFRGDKK